MRKGLPPHLEGKGFKSGDDNYTRQHPEHAVEAGKASARSRALSSYVKLDASEGKFPLALVNTWLQALGEKPVTWRKATPAFGKFTFLKYRSYVLGDMRAFELLLKLGDEMPADKIQVAVVDPEVIDEVESLLNDED